MASRRIDVQAALAKVSDTRTLRIASGALRDVAGVLERDFAGHSAVLVADERTYAAAGAEVASQLRGAGLLAAEPLVFPGTPAPYPDHHHLERVQSALAAHEAVPLVVGAGSLNDLTKLASHRLGRPYLCVATAASMDGYTSFGAIVTEDGFKRTYPCPAPRAVIADLDVLAAAPSELNAAGYGDLLGKVTAGADWLLADALGIEPIDAEAWAMVQQPLRGWLADPAAIRSGDADALERLFEGLTMVGIAMQWSASSRPASGAEHRFSHLWEMQALAERSQAHSHGAKVGIGSIVTAALYEHLLTRDLGQLDVEAAVRAYPTAASMEASTRALHAHPVVADNAVQETLAKHLSPAALRERLERLRDVWPSLRSALQGQLVSASTLQGWLADVGAPSLPHQVGVDSARLRASHDAARTIRSRYTVLDLLFEAKLQDEIVAELFAPGGAYSSMLASMVP